MFTRVSSFHPTLFSLRFDSILEEQDRPDSVIKNRELLRIRKDKL